MTCIQASAQICRHMTCIISSDVGFHMSMCACHIICIKASVITYVHLCSSDDLHSSLWCRVLHVRVCSPNDLHQSLWCRVFTCARHKTFIQVSGVGFYLCPRMSTCVVIWLASKPLVQNLTLHYVCRHMTSTQVSGVGFNPWSCVPSYDLHPGIWCRVLPKPLLQDFTYIHVCSSYDLYRSLCCKVFTMLMCTRHMTCTKASAEGFYLCPRVLVIWLAPQVFSVGFSHVYMCSSYDLRSVKPLVKGFTYVHACRHIIYAQISGIGVFPCLYVLVIWLAPRLLV